MGKVFVYGMGGLITIGLVLLIIVGGAICVRWAKKILGVGK